MTIDRARAGGGFGSAARDEPAWLDDLFDDAPIGLQLVAADGTILRANRMSYAPFGYAAGDYIGRPVATFHADPAAIASVLDRLQREDVVRDVRTAMRCEDGSVRSVVVDASARRRDGRLAHAVWSIRDESGRVRVQDEARASRAQLASAMADALPVLISYVDRDHRYRFNNRGYAEWFGIRLDDILGKTLEEVIGRDGYSVIAPHVDAALAGENVTYESLVPYKDGGQRWIRASYVPDRGPQGEVRGFFAIVEDISKPMRADEALRASEERYALATQATRDAIWDWDLRSDATTWGEALTSVFGWSPPDMQTPEPWWADRIHPEDRERVRESIQRAIGGDQSHWEDAYRFQHTDGSYRAVHDRGFIVRDASGAAARMVGALSDVTEERAAENALRESEERKRAVVNAAVDGIVAIDEQGTIQSFNPAAVRLFGYAAEEVIGRNISILMPEPYLREHPDYLERYLRTGERRVIGIGRDVEAKRKDGTTFPVNLAVSELNTSAGRLFTGFVHDLTERVQAEDALREREARYRSLVEAMPALVVTTTNEGEISDISTSYTQYTGLTLDEARDWQRHQVIHPDDLAQAMAVWERALASGEPMQNEFRMRRHDGAYRWFLVNAVPMGSLDGSAGKWITVSVDVDDRRSAQSLLEYQFGLTATITDNASGGLMMMDRRGRITFLNPAAELITGYRFEDVAGQLAHEKFHFVHVDGRPYRADECPIERANETMTMLTDYDDVFVRQDGSFYNVRCNVAPVVRGGEQIGALIEIRDTTDEKRAEQRDAFLYGISDAINSSLEFDRMLVDLAARAVPAVADVAVVGVFNDGPATTRYGTALADEAQRPFVERIHVRGWPAAQGSAETVGEVMLTGRTLLIEDATAWIEGAAPNAQQRETALALSLRSIICTPLMVRGEAVGMMTFALTRSGRRYTESDRVTLAELARRAGMSLENARLYGELQDSMARERFLSEARRVLGQSLNESEQLLELGALPVPAVADISIITRFQDDGRNVVHVGPAGATEEERVQLARLRIRDWRVHDGRSVGETLGAAEPVFIPDTPEWIDVGAPDKVQRSAARKLGLQSMMAVPIMLRGRPIGTMIWLRRGGSPAFARRDLRLAEEVARRASTSIENARLYGDLQQAAEELQRANNAKDEFLGLVSHELKTPITTIYGNAEVLERRGASLPATAQAEAIADIRIESERLHRIVDNLLVLARLERGQAIDAEPILLRRIVSRVIEEHKKRFPDRIVELRHPEPLVPALAAPESIEQVVRNLLSNAEKYSPTESPIEVTIGQEGNEAVVRVLDRGPGVPASELENVFTPFYRSPRTSSATPGAGIGLAVCRRLIEAQSGRMWACERAGGGSEFAFSVQVAEEE